MYEYMSETVSSKEISEFLNYGGVSGWRYVSCQLIAEDKFIVIMDRYVNQDDTNTETIVENSIAMRG